MEIDRNILTNRGDAEVKAGDMVILPVPARPSYRRRTKSTPPSPNTDKNCGSTGYEVTIYESKSCESIRRRRTQLGPEITQQFLLREVLYTAIHMLGKPSPRFPCTQEDILAYAQITFAKDVPEQIEFIQSVTAEPFPLTIVNVGIRRAENLPLRDKNGLCDAYCLISVETQDSMDKTRWKFMDKGSPKEPKSIKTPKERERPIAEKRFHQDYESVPKSIRTSVIPQNPNPTWEERFQCLALRPSYDILHIEVWDRLNQAVATNSVLDKTQVSENNSQGDAVHRGKYDQFIGKVMTSISQIPVEGEEQWCYLQGKTHRGHEAEGRLLVQNWLTHSFRHGANYEGIAHPRMILEKLWDFVLAIETKRHDIDGEWNGDIPLAATCLLFQYGLQTGMSESTQAMIRFNAYAKRHLLNHGGTQFKQLGTSLQRHQLAIDTNRIDRMNHCDQQDMINTLITSLRIPFLTIQMHLKDKKQDKVEEALKSFRYAIVTLEGCGANEQINYLITEMEVSLRIAVLEWYQVTFLTHIRDPIKQSKVDVICSINKIAYSAKEVLNEGQTIWKMMFWMEGNIDYLPIVYDELQRLVLGDVEWLTCKLLQCFDNKEVLRQALFQSCPDHRAMCRCLFELYIETQGIVRFKSQIFSTPNKLKEYCHLEAYFNWFRPVLVLWLGFAFIRASELIKKCITLDAIIPETDSFITSSALDTVVIFNQLAGFDQELDWPDPLERAVVTIFIIDVISYIGVLYGRIKRKIIGSEGYFDTVDRFDISDRLCIALNNIQYVQDSIQTLPTTLHIDDLMTNLESTMGKSDETVSNCHERIIQSLSSALVDIENELKIIITGIEARVSPEIRPRCEESVVMLQDEDGFRIEPPFIPLLDYLEVNLRILHKFLLPINLQRLIQMFWVVICRQFIEVFEMYPCKTTQEQQKFFRDFKNLLPSLITYLEGNGAGISQSQVNCDEFLNMSKYLELCTLDSVTLKSWYFVEQAKDQEVFKDSRYGTLTVRTSFYDGKLCIQVISAQKLFAGDEVSHFWDSCIPWSHEPSSDPRVDIEIILNGNLEDYELQRTNTRKKTLDPIFNEQLDFHLDQETVESPNSVIRFTVMDVDVLSKNDFLGEAFVLLSRIPGIANQHPIPQPMHLQLRSFDKRLKNPYISILKSRNWEVDSNKFVESQFKRCVQH